MLRCFSYTHREMPVFIFGLGIFLSLQKNHISGISEHQRWINFRVEVKSGHFNEFEYDADSQRFAVSITLIARYQFSFPANIFLLAFKKPYFNYIQAPELEKFLRKRKIWTILTIFENETDTQCFTILVTLIARCQFSFSP